MTLAEIYAPVLSKWNQRVLLMLVLFWLVGTLAFWHWALQPSAWVSVPGTLFSLLLLIYATGIPAWPFYLFLRMRQVRSDLPLPPGLRAAMVVTKAPSEPWPLVQHTLEAMLEQQGDHDTWLADELPTDQVRQWCLRHGVKLSTRAGVDDHPSPTWARRTGCKAGNLAYFYDHHGYSDYDVVVQLDADHVPQPGYLIAMLQPFNDSAVGYVAAPSICSANANRSWVARGRLYAESLLHGPMQLGLNGSWAELCFGSHYAVRTQALQEAGVLGPELADDHSTTLLLNAQGWRGAFAHRALCLAFGLETFNDVMVQELQWSRSLTTTLIRHLPPLLFRLPLHLRLQFIYAWAFYPLGVCLSLFALGLPVLALLFDHRWMRIHDPSFLVFIFLQMALTIMPMLFLRSYGLLRLSNISPLSWEYWLFELSRGPWVFAGVVGAVQEWLRSRPVNFRGKSQQSVNPPLPLSLLMPYLLAVVIGLLFALVLGDSVRLVQGYVLLTLTTTATFAVTAMSIAVLSHRQGDHSFRHLPQIGLAGATVLIMIGCCLWRMPEVTAPLQMPYLLPQSIL
jgi:cellulose synthase (UDP-forming)